MGKCKYIFGANNINTDGSGIADCSSYTQWVFKQNGINIGRNTESQYSHGTSVPKNELKPGDLVFFKDTYDSRYKDGVSHVGIYIGNNQFIHNSSGKGEVTISDLNSAYYKSHYLGAKRVTTKDGDTVEDVESDSKSNKEDTQSEDKDLRWWGDVIVLILTILLIVLALVFSFQAFGLKLPTIKGVKNELLKDV